MSEKLNRFEKSFDVTTVDGLAHGENEEDLFWGGEGRGGKEKGGEGEGEGE